MNSIPDAWASVVVNAQALNLAIKVGELNPSRAAP